MPKTTFDLQCSIDEGVYEALRQTNPSLVDSISNLLAKGQSPAQIERHLIKCFGHRDIVRYARATAEHLQRIG